MEDWEIEHIVDSLADIASAIRELSSVKKDNTNTIVESDNSIDKVHQLRDGILHQLEAKTSWGRLQLIEIITNLVDNIEEEEE